MDDVLILSAIPIAVAVLAAWMLLAGHRVRTLIASTTMLVVVGIAVGTTFVSEHETTLEDQRQRTILNHAVVLAAPSLPLTALDALSRTTDDYQRPEYHQVVNRLQMIRSQLPQATSVAVREVIDETVRTVAVDLPRDHPNHSPPGDPRHDRPESLYRHRRFVASTASSLVYGPSVVSINGNAPVITVTAKIPGHPSLFLDVDVAMDDWLLHVEQRRVAITIAGCVVQCLLLLCLGLLLLETRRNDTAKQVQKLMHACARLAEELFRSEDPLPTLHRILGDLGRAAGVQRVLLYRNQLRPDQQQRMVLALEWAAPGRSTLRDDPAHNDVPYAPALARWLDVFAAGRMVIDTVDSLPAGELSVLSAHQLQSIIAVPIISSGKVWGFLMYVDCDRPRRWQLMELDALAIIADSLGSALARQRTARDLARAKTAAEEATNAKSAFLANMSHEIRTPLNGIMGMAGLMLDTRLTRDQREFAETIRVSGEALLSVINDILDLSKVESGRTVLEAIDFSPRAAVEDAATLIAEKAQAKGLEFIVHVHPSVPSRLIGDPGRLRQVVLNLAGNAVKFTARGDVVVHVSTVETTNGRAMLDLAFSDTGIGMDSDAVAKLFQPFTQADASTTRQFGGTGLGLAISHGLVTLMGGTIRVESDPGRGTTFTCRIPFDISDNVGSETARRRQAIVGIVTAHGRLAAALADLCASLGQRHWHVTTAALASETCESLLWDSTCGPLSLAEVIAERVNATRILWLAPLTERLNLESQEHRLPLILLRKPLRQRALSDAVSGDTRRTTVDSSAVIPALSARVLVVDDNAVNQRLAAAYLEKLGCRCDLAATGSEAVAATARVPYDVVLMDCLMPEMDGFAATQSIRRREKEAGLGQHLPIIALTAGVMLEQRHQCRDAGMDDVLAKPLRLEQLADMLQRHVAPPAIIDHGTLERIAQDAGPESVTILLRTWLQELPSLLARLHDAADSDMRRMAAHSLRGSAKNLGLGALAMCATVAESSSVDDAAWRESLAPLIDCAAKTKEHVQAMMQQWGATDHG